MSKKFDVNTLPEIANLVIEDVQSFLGKGDDEAGIIGKYAVTTKENPGFFPAGVVVPIVAQIEVNGIYLGFFKGIEGADQGSIPADQGDAAVWSLGRLGVHFELADETVEA